MKFGIYYPRALAGDGGVTTAVWGWAKALVHSGHAAVIFYDPTLEGGTQIDPNLEIQDIPHTGIGRLRRPTSFAPFLDCSYLILQSGYIPANILVARSARTANIPYVVVPHGAYGAAAAKRGRLRKLLWGPIERAYLEKALAVHVFFDEECDLVRKIAPRARFIVAPTGVDVDADQWTRGGHYVGWFGRYDIWVKGLDLLVAAWAEIDSAKRPLLVLHGKDSRNTRLEVQSLVSEMSLDDSVRVEGALDSSARRDFLLNSAGMVFASRSESHSLAVAEALARGVPCVLSSTMPISSSLAAEGAAFVSDLDPQNLARACRQLIASGSAVSDSARKYVGEHLDWATCTQSFLDQLVNADTSVR